MEIINFTTGDKNPETFSLEGYAECARSIAGAMVVGPASVAGRFSHPRLSEIEEGCVHLAKARRNARDSAG